MSLVDQIYQGVQSLPTLPTIYTQLSEAVENPRATAGELADILGTDQAAASKILRVANSAYFGIDGNVDTISEAIVHLGFNEVKNIVAAISIVDMFSRKKTLENFRPVDFWKHSFGVGLMTRYLGRSMGLVNVETLFLAGILHDIGKLIFFEYAADQFGEALIMADEKCVPLREAEMCVLGIDHTLAGELAADRWKLPQSIKNAIRFHHFGHVNGKYNLIVASVHVANIYARLFDMGFSGDALIPQPNMKVWEILQIPPKAISSLVPRIYREYNDMILQFLEN